MRRVKGLGDALVITKWSDLGQGEHPQDERSRRHLSVDQILGGEVHLVPASGENSPRCDFERGHGKNFAVLTDELADVLETGKYKEDFEDEMDRCHKPWPSQPLRDADVWVRRPGWPGCVDFGDAET